MEDPLKTVERPTFFFVNHYSSPFLFGICQIFSFKFLVVHCATQLGYEKFRDDFFLRFKERYLGFITNRTCPFDIVEAIKPLCPL